MVGQPIVVVVTNNALHLHSGFCHGSCFRNNRAIS